MTKKEEKEYKKELLDLLIGNCIGGDVSKLNNKNRKLYKEITGKNLNTSIFTMEYIKEQFYNWVVDCKDYELNSNFERIVYLFNHNYELCGEMLEVKEIEVVEKDYEVTFKTSKEFKSYNDLAEEVGL